MRKTNRNVRISTKFNKSAISEFEKQDAFHAFLSPIGMNENSISLLHSAEWNEIAYFKALHYVKWRMSCAQSDKDRLFWTKIFETIRNHIVVINMSLVYDCIQKTSITGVDKDTLISDGSMALISAVESFDPWRGFKFSTYACRSILYRFNAAAKKMSKVSSLDITEIDPPDEESDCNLDFYIDRLQSAIHKTDLTDREKEILQLRFSDKKRTLGEISEIYNLSKERIRQIQVAGINKIRKYMESDQFLRK